MSQLKPLILVGGLPRAGKSSFINRVAPLVKGAKLFDEEHYVSQVNPRSREYALDYHENASFLVKQAMLKDVKLATQEHKPVIVESNFFVDARMRKLYRDTCLDHRTHIPIYVSVYIPNEIRMGNRPLDKYTQADNDMFNGLNKRPKKSEGFIVLSVREVFEFLKERNGTT